MMMAGDAGVDMVASSVSLLAEMIKDGKEFMFSCISSGTQLSPVLFGCCCVWTGGRVGV